MSEYFSLEEVVDITVGNFAERAHAEGINISAHICPDACSKFMGEASVLESILVKLLSNALKHTSEGYIRVNVEPDMKNKAPGAIHFSVSDTGCGIAPEKQEHIFEPKAQPENAVSGEMLNTAGHGLAVTKQLVDQIGGSLWVESTVGTGSTFFFTASYDVKPCGGHCSY
ncbi:hypothetical protein MNBD_GAMMA26-2253 [hydrothermal vent metagenome]|uniref:histidine kinase n=1 Tax=hydrothermal vent metagenome TaxID=652676 RepID=A0A3B1BAL8_9ZZZZ